MSAKIGNPANILSGLSGRQRMALLQELFASQTGPAAGRRLEAGQLALAESWLETASEAKGSPSCRNSAERMWFIFMLLRYGGLRLKEVFGLKYADCHFGESYVEVGSRQVFFSRRIGQRLAAKWLTWPGRHAGLYPFYCDSSQVRRSLGACGRACGIEAALLSSRALRRQRGLELEAGGLHPGLVSHFLGRPFADSPYSPELACKLLKMYFQKENEMKTSARNVFHGQVSELSENGILVKVGLTTPEGLIVVSIITAASRENLGLEKGSFATALVKAPWVSVIPENQRALAAENCYAAVIEKITRDELACEINATLDKGGTVCSLYANGANPPQEIKEGSHVFVSFSPFAVIITAD